MNTHAAHRYLEALGPDRDPDRELTQLSVALEDAVIVIRCEELALACGWFNAQRLPVLERMRDGLGGLVRRLPDYTAAPRLVSRTDEEESPLLHDAARELAVALVRARCVQVFAQLERVIFALQGGLREAC